MVASARYFRYKRNGNFTEAAPVVVASDVEEPIVLGVPAEDIVKSEASTEAAKENTEAVKKD